MCPVQCYIYTRNNTSHDREAVRFWRLLSSKQEKYIFIHKGVKYADREVTIILEGSISVGSEPYTNTAVLCLLQVLLKCRKARFLTLCYFGGPKYFENERKPDKMA
jgi:hypothetical protein